MSGGFLEFRNDVQVLVDHDGFVELHLHFLASVEPKTLESLIIQLCHLDHFVCEVLRIFQSAEQTVIVVLNYLVASGNIRGDNRFRTACCLEQGMRRAFTVGGQHDTVGRLDKGLYILRRTEVLDGFLVNPLLNYLYRNAASVSRVFGAKHLESRVDPLSLQAFDSFDIFKYAFVSDKPGNEKESKFPVSSEGSGCKSFQIDAGPRKEVSGFSRNETLGDK